MKNNLLLLDLNNLIHISVYSAKPKIYKGKQIGPFTNFLSSFCSYVNKYNPEDIICCFDYPPYERKEIYPEYKKSRVKNTDMIGDIVQTRTYIKEFLELMNITIWKDKGLEADDLFAYIVNKYKTKYANIVICSNDSDLYQLLDTNIILQKTKDKTYTIIDFNNEYSINIKEWSKVLSLAGTHNNIKGIEKIGIKTAIKKLNINSNFWNEIIEKYPFLEVNNKLIKLPLRELKENLEINKPSFSSRVIINWLLRNFKLELKSFHLDALNHLERL